MKVLLLTGLCFIISGCNDGNYNRGYVISKSPVEPESAEVENECVGFTAPTTHN